MHNRDCRTRFSKPYRNSGVAEFPAEAGHIAVENRAGHAHIIRALHIQRQIVDKEALLRFQAEFPEQGLVNLVLGLQQLPVGGDNLPVEALAAGMRSK